MINYQLETIWVKIWSFLSKTRSMKLYSLGAPDPENFKTSAQVIDTLSLKKDFHILKNKYVSNLLWWKSFKFLGDLGSNPTKKINSSLLICFFFFFSIISRRVKKDFKFLKEKYPSSLKKLKKLKKYVFIFKVASVVSVGFEPVPWKIFKPI